MGLRTVEEQLVCEERWNAITHGVATVLSFVAMIALIAVAMLKHDLLRTLTVAVFGLALVLLYSVSTCYHACTNVARKRAMRVLDHAAIYVLIAATYTPLLLVLMPGPLAWTLMGVLWTAAIVGVGTTIRCVDQSRIRSTLLYVAMGWVGLIAVRPMLHAMPVGCTLWILAGGVTYTAGVIFYLWKSLPFHHAVWHVFVFGGSVCHFIAVWWYVLPGRG